MKKKLKKGILLVQLGTPDAPTTAAVRRYLDEFLMDGRVMDIPYINRVMLVKGIIVPIRGPKSAKTYKTVWDWKDTKGSPLMHYSIIQQKRLQEELGDTYHVELAMRYQNPSISHALKRMASMMLESICIIPMFPQYASATTGSILDKVMSIIQKWQFIPHITFISNFCEDSLYIDTIVEQANKHDLSSFDHFLFSYHGLPVRQLAKVIPSLDHDCSEETGENCKNVVNPYCYFSQCHATTRAIVSRLQLSPEQYTLCFQSRLGKTPWIQPYTSDVLHRLAEQGKKKLLVFSPAFVSDCIETIDEILVEYGDEFKKLGGESIDMVESLNDNPTWIKSLKSMVLNNN